MIAMEFHILLNQTWYLSVDKIDATERIKIIELVSNTFKDNTRMTFSFTYIKDFSDTITLLNTSKNKAKHIHTKKTTQRSCSSDEGEFINKYLWSRTL